MTTIYGHFTMALKQTKYSTHFIVIRNVYCLWSSRRYSSSTCYCGYNRWREGWGSFRRKSSWYLTVWVGVILSKDYAVLPSIQMFNTMLWCTCLLLCGVEVATSSINDKDSHQYHERSGSHFEMQVEASLQPIRINSWPECFMEWVAVFMT